jgi:uncharacterized protein YjgD (DUF1641 family)
MTTELERAIHDNPEEVAERVRRMGAEDEILEGLDTEGEDGDGRTGGGEGGTTVHETVEQNSEEMSEALVKVAELERNGTLDELVEIADALTVLSSALDDEMVMSVAKTGGALGEVADSASDEDTVRTLESAMDSVSRAKRESEPMGLIGAVRASRSQEFRRSLGFLISVARNLGEELDEK